MNQKQGPLSDLYRRGFEFSKSDFLARARIAKASTSTQKMVKSGMRGTRLSKLQLSILNALCDEGALDRFVAWRSELVVSSPSRNESSAISRSLSALKARGFVNVQDGKKDGLSKRRTTSVCLTPLSVSALQGEKETRKVERHLLKEKQHVEAAAKAYKEAWIEAYAKNPRAVGTDENKSLEVKAEKLRAMLFVLL